MSNRLQNVIFVLATLVVLVWIVGRGRPDTALPSVEESVDLLLARSRVVDTWSGFQSGRDLVGGVGAAVTMVVWSDYQCPACKAFHDHLEAVLRSRTDVAVDVRHWPLPNHPRALPAALAAECARQQGRLPQMHERLMTHEDLSTADFETIALGAGVEDSTRFRLCLSDEATAQTVRADVEAAREIGATGTPTIMVNGLVLGALPDSILLGALISDLAGDGR